MNGISNGDGTYKPLSNSDALVGKASDLPYPQKSVTENIALLHRVESGVENIAIPSGSAYGEKSITFATPFSKKPFITLTCESGTGTGSNVPDAVLTALSTSGCTIRVWRTTGASTSNGATPNVYWKAEELA